MSKELFIASSPHETKVAVLEDDRLVEVYYERDTDVGLVGGIYKGRVSRVLPGMQSAFVDIGLERDAFLYVSDLFLEDQEEYEKVFDEAEDRAARFAEQSSRSESGPAAVGGQASEPGPTSPNAVVEPTPGAPEPNTIQAPAESPATRTAPPEEKSIPSPSGPVLPARHATDQATYRRPEYRGRRRRRGRGFSEHGFAHRPADTAPRHFEILPGESLAKYSHARPGLASSSPAVGVPGEPSAISGEAAPTPRREEDPSSQPNAAAETAFVKHSRPGSTEAAQPHVTAGAATYAEPSVNRFPALATERELAPSDRSGPESSTPQKTESQLSENALLAGPVGRAVSPETEPGFEDAAWGPAEENEDAADEMPASGAAHSADVNPLAEPAALGDAGREAQAVADVSASGGPEPSSTAIPGGTVTEPSERTYTRREPYQRPHYAPRRSPRGRRGGPRPRFGRPDRPRRGNGQPPQISQLLKEGQEILVQIAKEPLGTKGARITSHIALPGRYLVFMPTISHIGVSRKIASEQERLRLRNIILENKGSLSGGFIVRTAGEGRPEEELKADLRFLATLWNDIKSRTDAAKAPALVHRDLGLVQRILRDTLSSDFKSVRVDSEAEYERVMDFVSRCQPALAGHVKLYTRDTPLFEEFGIEAEIENALKPKVWLKSGGYIVINQTEALVAIDVNTGKYVGKTNRLEDTILKTNIDAVNEIVRQIRLRDLGGIIVIDFIDMDERRNRIKVVQALEDALHRDRAPTKITSFHDFGLVAITRKRVKQSLERTLCEPCEYCAGAGWVRSVTTVCYQILAEARKMATQIEGNVITLRVSPEVARGLKSRDGLLVSELESLTRKDVIIKSDPTVHRERFEIF